MSSAAKKSDRRPPAATDAGAHRRHLAGDRLRETMSGLPLAGVYGPADLRPPAGPMTTGSATRGSSRSRAARTRRCTAASRGRCACSPASARPRTRTSRFKFLLEHGQTGLSTAFDMPTLMGYDPDHPRSLGEVGREGVSVASLDDMERPVRRHPARPGDDVDDDQRAGGRAARVLRRGRPSSSGIAARRSCAARSRTTCSRSSSRRRSGSAAIRPHMRIIRDMLVYCTAAMPLWNTI